MNELMHVSCHITTCTETRSLFITVTYFQDQLEFADFRIVVFGPERQHISLVACPYITENHLPSKYWYTYMIYKMLTIY